MSQDVGIDLITKGIEGSLGPVCRSALSDVKSEYRHVKDTAQCYGSEGCCSGLLTVEREPGRMQDVTA